MKRAKNLTKNMNPSFQHLKKFHTVRQKKMVENRTFGQTMVVLRGVEFYREFRLIQWVTYKSASQEFSGLLS